MDKFRTRGEMLVKLALEKKYIGWGENPANSYVNKKDDGDDADDVFQKTGEIITPLEKEIIMEDQDCENNELGVLNVYVSDILDNYDNVPVPVNIGNPISLPVSIHVAKRRRKSTTIEWKQNESIKQRSLGKAYSGKKLIDGVWTTVERPAREMGKLCTKETCTKSNKKHCNEFLIKDCKKYI